MPRRTFGAIVATALLFPLAACSSLGSFSIDGLWKSSGGTMIAFQHGSASASLFGFNGGPDGTYQFSGKQSDGSYELYGSHLTGGTVDYLVTVQDGDHISLALQGVSSYAPKQLVLERQ